MSNVHPTAIVEDGAFVHPNAKVWHFCHVRKNARVEENASLGRDVFIDEGVVVSRGTRIQNGVSVYRGIEIGENVFIGPHVVLTNDVYPRASVQAWDVAPTQIKTGAAIGAGAIIRCGISIGEFAMIGAGAIVTKDVPAFSLVLGTPARVIKSICLCGRSESPEVSVQTTIQECCEKYLTKELIAAGKKAIEQVCSQSTLGLQSAT